MYIYIHISLYFIHISLSLSIFLHIHPYIHIYIYIYVLAACPCTVCLCSDALPLLMAGVGGYLCCASRNRFHLVQWFALLFFWFWLHLTVPVPSGPVFKVHVCSISRSAVILFNLDHRSCLGFSVSVKLSVPQEMHDKGLKFPIVRQESGCKILSSKWDFLEIGGLQVPPPMV